MAKSPSAPIRIGIIADLHIGSQYALVPPSFRAAGARPSDVFMAYMWSCWEHFVQHCPPLDVLISNGDELEGTHPTLRSAPESVDQSPLRQVDMAVETLAPLRAKAKAFWLVRGTGFHTGPWYEAIEALGRELKAETWARRRYSGEVLDGEIGGLRVNVAHPQTTGAIYPGTLANRTAWFASLAERLEKTVEADVIVRSHTHSTGLGRYQGKWVLSTRCWKLVNGYAISRMEYYRAQALLDLGAHVITIGPDGLAWKDFPYAPYKTTHRKLLG
jgi:hypothetical protein